MSLEIYAGDGRPSARGRPPIQRLPCIKEVQGRTSSDDLRPRPAIHPLFDLCTKLGVVFRLWCAMNHSVCNVAYAKER